MGFGSALPDEYPDKATYSLPVRGRRVRVPGAGDRPKITAGLRLFRRVAIRSEVHLVGTKISPATPFQSPGPACKQDFRNHVMRAEEPALLPRVEQIREAPAGDFIQTLCGADVRQLILAE